MSQDEHLRKQLVGMLTGGQAHATFDETTAGFPLHGVGIRLEGMAHSAWELLEHIRIAQNDILRFSQSASYVGMKWPADYWPASPEPRSSEDWARSVGSFHEDLAAFKRLVEDPGRDLYQPFPWGDGETLLREALLIVDHNAYHLGQLMLVRRTLENRKS